MEVQFTSPDSEFCSQPIHYRPCLFGLVKSPMFGEEINEGEEIQKVEFSPRLFKIQKRLELTVNFGMML